MARTRERERQDEVVILDDAALLGHAVQGDGASVDELYRRHADAALRVAYAVVTNKEDAADAVSEAFLKVLRVVQEGRFPPGVAFRPYLLVAARNAALDIGRSQTRLQKVAQKEQPNAKAAESPASADFVLDGVDAQFVAAAFSQLPERWRSVLWLTEVEGVPAREVAPILGLSANGVAQLAVRARNGLRNAYLQVHLQGHVDDACKSVVGDLGAYVGGALTAREIAKVDQHLAGCESCRERRDELEDLRTTLRRIAFPLPLALGAGIAAKWKLAVASSAAASQVAAPVVKVGVTTLNRLRAPLTTSAGAIAAVGIIFLGVHDAAAPPDDRDQAGSRPRARVGAPQAIVDGFDLRLGAGSSLPEDDALLIASPRMTVTPVAPPVVQSPQPSPGPGTGTPRPGGSSGPAPTPPTPVPLAQADVGVPALDTQVSVGAGAGSCTSVQLTLLDIGNCPAPSGSGPLTVRLGGSLLGG